MTPFWTTIALSWKREGKGTILVADPNPHTETSNGAERKRNVLPLGLVLGPRVGMKTVCLCMSVPMFLGLSQLLWGHNGGQPRLGIGNPNCDIPT